MYAIVMNVVIPAIISVFILVLFSWVLFRSVTFNDAVHFFGAMFGFSGVQGGSVLLSAEIYTQGNFIIMVICTYFAFIRLQAFDWVKDINYIKIIVLIITFCLSLMIMFVQAFNPFLYFQF